MKKNLYYRSVNQRRNVIKEWFFAFFLAIASWPRLLLEVFIRKNFGERYFSFSLALLLFAILFLLPAFSSTETWMMFFLKGRFNVNFLHVISKNVTWYLFLAAFLYASIRRESEVERSVAVYNLRRVSDSAGEIHPRFRALRLAGQSPDPHTIETLLEPGLFFLIGFALGWMGQSVGVLLMSCSMIYSLSYFAAYNRARNILLDLIDEMIYNEEMVTAFVDELDSSQTRGAKFYFPRIADPEIRRRIADFIEEEDEVEAR